MLNAGYNCNYSDFITSGKDGEAMKIIYACFAGWMIFGVYRGFRHIFSKPDKKPCPTFEGVSYNITPVSDKKVIEDFLILWLCGFAL